MRKRILITPTNNFRLVDTTLWLSQKVFIAEDKGTAKFVGVDHKREKFPKVCVKKSY